MSEREQLLICYNELKLSATFNNWVYCTELNGVVDHCQIHAPSKYNTIHRNVIVESGNHDVHGMIRDYNETLVSVKANFKPDEQSQSIMGIRRCADIVSSGQLNCFIDTLKMKAYFPYVRNLCENVSSGGRAGAIGVDLKDVMANEEMVDGMTMFKFTSDYNTLMVNIKNHEHCNTLISPEIINTETEYDQKMGEHELDSVKAIILSSGQIIMNGNTNRISVVRAFYVLLQMIACCVC